jgi:uncharacterized membrane protein
MKTYDSRIHTFIIPWYGWVGLSIMACAQIFLAIGIRFFAVWLTPIMWTGYILAADGIVHRLRGHSWLSTRRLEAPLLALTSIGVWLIFEVYNFHLQNWIYLGVPENPLLRNLSYFWSFATIMPGVFETADLVESLFHRLVPTHRINKPVGRLFPDWAWFILGISMLAIPLALPTPIAAYLFGFIWIGFIPLLDPINERLAIPSLRVQWRSGNRVAIYSLLIGGMLCGFLWETWNYQAAQANGGHWVYTLPQALRIFGWHFGKMPMLGLLGFPPFALELFNFYYLLRELLGGDAIFGRSADRLPSMDA